MTRGRKEKSGLVPFPEGSIGKLNRSKAPVVNPFEETSPQPVQFLLETPPSDDSIAFNAQKLTGQDKGNVLLENVKATQRVLLNATVFLDQTFVFEPDLRHLTKSLKGLSPVARTDKDQLFVFYNQIRRRVLSFKQIVRHPKEKNEDHWDQLYKFRTDCETLAVLRQLCFGEPIPLIDMESLNDKKPRKGRRSSARARKLQTSASSNATQNEAASHEDDEVPDEIEDDAPAGDENEIIHPSMAYKDGAKQIFAAFPRDLRRPSRLIMNLKDILNITGCVATSHAFLLDCVDLFKQRVDIDKAEVQQVYRETFQACNEFINQEGTDRSEDEWHNFITNCVHMYALRHVLHNKPLLGFLAGENAEQDHIIDDLLQKMHATTLQSDQQHSDDVHGVDVASCDDGDEANQASCPRIEPGGNALEDFNLEEITVGFQDCIGCNHGVIINGSTLVNVKKRAQNLCQKDITAAKLYYNYLTESCRRPCDDIVQLQDKARIGIKQAVEEMRCFTQDCLYLCVLRQVLHNVPVQACPGRQVSPAHQKPDEGVY